MLMKDINIRQNKFFGIPVYKQDLFVTKRTRILKIVELTQRKITVFIF